MRETTRPAPQRDLDTPEEIAEMVRRFYADVAQDDLLGPMFNDVARVDWSEHLPKLTAFWCRALLGMPGYSGNPFQRPCGRAPERSFTAAHFGAGSRCSTRPSSSAGSARTPTVPPSWPTTSLGCTAISSSANPSPSRLPARIGTGVA